MKVREGGREPLFSTLAGRRKGNLNAFYFFSSSLATKEGGGINFEWARVAGAICIIRYKKSLLTDPTQYALRAGDNDVNEVVAAESGRPRDAAVVTYRSPSVSLQPWRRPGKPLRRALRLDGVVNPPRYPFSDSSLSRPRELLYIFF